MRGHILAMVFLAGCSGGAGQIDDSRNYLHAALTLADGRSLTFDEPAGVLLATADSRWIGVSAADPTQGYAVDVSWDPKYTAVTGTYNALFGSYVDIQLQYPATPGGTQYGVAASGHVTFARLDKTSGGVISGTFDDVRLVDAPRGVATTNLVATLAGGSFRALIP